MADDTGKFKIQDEPGFKHRVLEVLLTTAASAASAALAVTWSVSALVTQVRLRIDKLETRMEHVESMVTANAELDNTQQVALALAGAHNDDVLRRLDSIETKIDRIGRDTR